MFALFQKLWNKIAPHPPNFLTHALKSLVCRTV
jgi:hypothetical protein